MSAVVVSAQREADFFFVRTAASFFAELSHFFYISLRFLCNFEEQLRKNQWR